jgi:hypothetical protein
MGFMQQFQPQAPQLQMKAQMSQLRSMLQGDTSALVSSLAQSNPAFAQFVAQNQGKTPQEAFSAYGYDFGEVSRLINS